MEDVLTQFEYLADSAKLASYRAAIDRAVEKDHVVLDLGCGTGVLGLLALKAGAARAYFVDNGSVIDVARQTVADAGFGDRATYYQANSYEVELPEQVDIVICDHVGYFGFDYGILQFLSDAKARFLRTGGIMIPAEIDLELGLVESEPCREIVSKWCDSSIPNEYHWVSESAANTKHGVELQANDVLAAPAQLGTLILGDEPTDYLSWDAQFEAERDGILDGVGGWFDCRLFDDIRMTNSPLGRKPLTRPQAFFPLANPVRINEGDAVSVSLMARPGDHVFGWVVELPSSEQRFSQTTFNGLQLDSDALTRANPDRIARLNERGRARQLVLGYCDGGRTVADVQALIQREHPDLFPSRHATESFVRSVLEWDTSD